MRLAEQTTYGETVAAAQELNLRGVIYQHRDEAGLASTERRDFDGNVVRTARQLLTDFSEPVDWALTPTLEAETFLTDTTFDALNRPVKITTPDGSVSEPSYNQRSLLCAVALTPAGGGGRVDYVKAITYDAKAQREAIEYGNGASSAYTYDPLTFRLVALRSTRPGGGEALQAIGYTYDAVGNVVSVEDAAQQTIFFANQVVAPTATYTYDAIYRLVSAEGREHIGQTASEPIGASDAARVAIPLPSDGQAMRNYTQTYAYDHVGNIEALTHAATGGGFKRAYAYDEPDVPPRSNRLTSTSVGATREAYAYDANGNVESMPHLSLMRWDWSDQLEATASQIVTEGEPETTYYRYDSKGRRVRKVTASGSGTRRSERTYIGAYEVYREYGPSGEVKLERQTLNISDGAGRICLLETTTIDTTTPGAPLQAPSTLTRYQLANLLGSAVLELDENAAIITYEEYYPFGSSSFQSGRSAAEVSLKRYRYTGKERDEESGFYYHGARYYTPWLGRWSSADPVGVRAGPNLYAYCGDNPVCKVDRTGTTEESSTSFGISIDAKGVSAGTFVVPPPRDLSGFVVAFGRTGLGRSYMDTAKANTGLPAVNIQDRINFQKGYGVMSFFPGSYQLETEYVDPARSDPAKGITGLYPMFSGVSVQEALERSETMHFDMREVDLTPKLSKGSLPGFSQEDFHASSEARQVVAHVAATDPGERVPTIVMQHEEGVSTITPDSNVVKGDPLPSRLASRMPNLQNAPKSPTPPPSSGSSGAGGSGGSRGGPTRTVTMPSPSSAALGGLGRMVPGVAETEIALGSAAMAAMSHPATVALAQPLMTAAEAVPVVAGVGIVGAATGHLARAVASEAGASPETANTVGLGAAVLTGAALGSVIPGVGTAVGAGIGALVAGGLYLWTL